jgi:hypothetical protein
MLDEGRPRNGVGFGVKKGPDAERRYTFALRFNSLLYEGVVPELELV